MPDVSQVSAFLERRHLRIAADAELFARTVIGRLRAAATDEEARTQARALLVEIGKAGWFGYAVPKAYGGRLPQPDLRACCLIREAFAAASPLADAVFALQCLGSMPVTLAGSAALKRRCLPSVAEGRAMAAFAMTEPEAGSDVASLQTTARRKGDGYLLNGRKTLISNAGIADFYAVFASTDPAAGRNGVSCFLVEARSPGLRFAKAQVLSAPHPLGEIVFDDCRVPAEHRLGVQGDGFKLGMAVLDRLRATVGAAACGMAARALAEALQHVARRKQFGRPLSDFQIVQEKLAVMATDLAAARLLVYRAAWAGDRGAQVTLESAQAKAYATEAAQRVVDQALQILGGRGMLAEHPVERLYRAVRSLRIYEGTTEIQHLVIARALLKGNA